MDYFTKNNTIASFLKHYQPTRWSKIMKLLAVYSILKIQSQYDSPPTEQEMLKLLQATFINTPTTVQSKSYASPALQQCQNTDKNGEQLINTLNSLKKKVLEVEDAIKENVTKGHVEPPNSMQTHTIKKNTKNIETQETYPTWWGDMHESSRDTVDIMIEKKAKEIKENIPINYTCTTKAPVLIKYDNSDLSKEKPATVPLNPIYYEKVKTQPSQNKEPPTGPKYYANPLKKRPYKVPKYLTKVKSTIKGDVAYDKKKYYQSQINKQNSQDANPIDMASESPTHVEVKQNENLLKPVQTEQLAHEQIRNDALSFKSGEQKPHGKSMMDNVEGLLSSSLVNQFSNEPTNVYMEGEKQYYKEADDPSLKEPLTASFNPQERRKQEMLKANEKQKIINENAIGTENRNEALYGNYTNKQSEQLSSNRTSAPDVPMSIQEGQESSPQSEVISSDTERKNDGDIYKSVPTLGNENYMRQRVESMPVDNMESQE